MTLRRILVFSILAAMAIPLGYVAYVALFLATTGMFGDCADEIQSRATSPDGTMEAIAVRRNCGATTRYSSHVRIVWQSQSYEERVLDINDDVSISVLWTDENDLSILLDKVDPNTISNQVKISQYVGIEYGIGRIYSRD